MRTSLFALKSELTGRERMREKQRYLIFKWKARPEHKDFESLIEKDLTRKLGDFGMALCGPRFKISKINDKGFVVKLRIEACKSVLGILNTYKSFKLVHISGSARLARRAIGKKFEGVAPNDLTIW